MWLVNLPTDYWVQCPLLSAVSVTECSVLYWVQCPLLSAVSFTECSVLYWVQCPLLSAVYFTECSVLYWVQCPLLSAVSSYNFCFTILQLFKSRKDLSFSGAFAKVWKPTISFVMSVCQSVRPYACLSVCIEQLASHWRIFIKFYIWVFFENVSRMFKLH